MPRLTRRAAMLLAAVAACSRDDDPVGAARPAASSAVVAAPPSSPAPRLLLGPIRVTGALSSAAVAAVLSAHAARFPCEPRGAVSVAFTISGPGKAGHVQVRQTDGMTAALSGCVSGEIERLDFPKADKETQVEVSFQPVR